MRRNSKKTRVLRRFSNRRAMALTEMLVVMAALLVIMAFATKMYSQVLGNLSRTHRDVQANTSVQDMLRQLRKDVENSSSLLHYPGNERTGGDLLLIDSPRGIISYEFDEGEVFRATEGAYPNEPAKDTWAVPHARIEWRLLQVNGRDRALAVTTSIERIVLDRPESKLRNSCVFFLGTAMGERD